MSETRALFVAAGGLALALPAGAVEAIHADVDIYPVPGVALPFAGVGALRGQLVPVSDLGHLLGGRSSRGRLLQLASPFAPLGLRVDLVFGVGSAIPEALNGREAKQYQGRPGLGSATLAWRGRRHAWLDIAALLHDPAFNSEPKRRAEVAAVEVDT